MKPFSERRLTFKKGQSQKILIVMILVFLLSNSCDHLALHNTSVNDVMDIVHVQTGMVTAYHLGRFLVSLGHFQG